MDWWEMERWFQVEDRLIELGMDEDESVQAIHHAQQRGSTAERVQFLIVYYASRPQRWNLATLFHRIASDDPRAPVESGWQHAR